MKKICIVMSSMTGGGAEKMVMYISNKLVEDPMKEIVLILFAKKGENLDKLNPKLKIIDLKSKLGIPGLFKLIKCLKELKPNIVFMSLGPLNAIFSPFLILFKNVKFIARETNVPSLINKIQSKKKKVYKVIDLLYKMTYKFFDVIVAQSDDMKNDLVQNYKIPRSKIIKINNLIDEEKMDALIKEEDDKVKSLFKEKRVYGIALGRLAEQKGYDLLIEKAKELKNTNIMIYILGNGEQKDILENKIIEYQLENNIQILPFDKNPYKYLIRSNFFVLPSRVEGFPNSLIEALGCGIPAIVNNCKGGINEIIINGFNGEIIDFTQSESLLSKIYDVIGYDKFQIKQNAADRFSKNKILNEYLKLFN